MKSKAQGNASRKSKLPSPAVIGVIPVRQLIVVVFPAPLGPRRQNSLSFSMFIHKP
jgi:hypothetical protein